MTHRQLFRYISDLAWHFDAVNPDILVHGERDRTVQDRGIQAVGLLHHSKDDDDDKGCGSSRTKVRVYHLHHGPLAPML